MMGMDKSGSFGTKKSDDCNSELHGGDCTDENESKESGSETAIISGLAQAIEDVERFLESLSLDGKESPPPTEAPECVEAFLTSVEKMIGNGGEDEEENEASFLAAVRKVSDLSKNLGKHSSSLDSVFNRASLILQKAMSYLEEEFAALLEDPAGKKKIGVVSAAGAGVGGGKEDCGADRCVLMSTEEQETIRSETVARLSAMALVMVDSGYEAECTAAYDPARKRAFRSAMEKIGYEGGLTADEVQKMPWDSVAREIETWICAARSCSGEIFPAERRLGEAILPGKGAAEAVVRWSTARLIGFAESVVVTKRSTDKVFKLLDMYEALRDLEKESQSQSQIQNDVEGDDVASAKRRIGEAAAGSFMELENSVKCEQGRTPVPSGGVHPVTRYVMNYVELACAYRETLEEVFREATSTELSRHVEAVMDVLDANLEAKSRLYQDVSLNHIFLMNNGRYIVQKIKASSEIHLLMGDAWCRRRSSELRQNHKSYQRETWGKVLHCLSHEGLQAQPGGKVSKPVLKERFKSFNAMFDDIHKTQTAWVVSDDQLQSELRVSISAVMIPAYRAFLARFKHCLDPGRQTEKYIKYQPEDIETMIDDLFDGNPASAVLRKRSNN